MTLLPSHLSCSLVIKSLARPRTLTPTVKPARLVQMLGVTLNNPDEGAFSTFMKEARRQGGYALNEGKKLGKEAITYGKKTVQKKVAKTVVTEIAGKATEKTVAYGSKVEIGTLSKDLSQQILPQEVHEFNLDPTSWGGNEVAENGITQEGALMEYKVGGLLTTVLSMAISKSVGKIVSVLITEITNAFLRGGSKGGQAKEDTRLTSPGLFSTARCSNDKSNVMLFLAKSVESIGQSVGSTVGLIVSSLFAFDIVGVMFGVKDIISTIIRAVASWRRYFGLTGLSDHSVEMCDKSAAVFAQLNSFHRRYIKDKDSVKGRKEEVMDLFDAFMQKIDRTFHEDAKKLDNVKDKRWEKVLVLRVKQFFANIKVAIFNAYCVIKYAFISLWQRGKAAVAKKAWDKKAWKADRKKCMSSWKGMKDMESEDDEDEKKLGEDIKKRFERAHSRLQSKKLKQQQLTGHESTYAAEELDSNPTFNAAGEKGVSKLLSPLHRHLCTKLLCITNSLYYTFRMVWPRLAKIFRRW